MKNVLMCVLGSLLFTMCCPERKTIKDPSTQAVENFMHEELHAESLVTVLIEQSNEETIITADVMGVDFSRQVKFIFTQDASIELHGVLGIFHRSLETGCFEIPTCVKIDDKHRGIIRKLPDDFDIYDDMEEVTGTTYFMSDFFEPYWAGNAAPQAFRNQVDNHGGGKYQNKRQGCCANNPEKCHCYE